MRLGGHIFDPYTDPTGWAAAHRQANFRAAYAPNIPDGLTPADFALAARQADLVIAEVGAWHNNPLSKDDAVRRDAIRACQEKLALADELGAICCVNVAGSRGPKWDGPSPEDLTPDTFDLIVATVREIIDGVNPTRTYYSLDPMPWMYPDSAESYLRLLLAIDRPRFGVHFDPVNLIYSPQRYFANAEVIREFVNMLGPHIKSVHIKDIIMHPNLTTHLDEVRPGLGTLDYPALLRALAPLGPDLPIMLEHMKLEVDYTLAAAFVRECAASVGVSL